jgi:biopolymer transport protein ExbB
MEWIEKGGPVMWPLLMLSVYVVAVVIYKGIELFAGKASHDAFVPDVLALARDGQTDRALEALRYHEGPMARVLAGALEAIRNPRLTPDAREQEVIRLGAAEIKRLESHLKGLDLAANIAPLLGLLGTVTGMMAAFSGIEQAGAKVNPSLLAGGIWEAMITTVAGLLIAVPAMAALYGFQAVIETIRHRMSDACTQLLAYPQRVVDVKPAATVGEVLAKPESAVKPQQPVAAAAADAPVPVLDFLKKEAVGSAKVEPAQPVATAEQKPAESKAKAPGKNQPRKVFAKRSSEF